jgi:hypothetical protein
MPPLTTVPRVSDYTALSGPAFLTMDRNWNEAYFVDSSADNLTAGGSSQAAALPLVAQNNRVTTVAAPGNGVVLPPALAGMEVFLINHGTSSMQVFANLSDTVNDVSGATGVPQMANSLVVYVCTTAGKWYSDGLATGYASGVGGGFQTFSAQPNITAHAGGGQGSAVLLTAMNCFLSTVASAGDSVVLPPAQPGMQVTVINQTATSANVFPSSGQSINALAVNTAFAVVGGASGSVTIFYAVSTSQWFTK